MGFNIDDVDKMFAEAASASEDTGEGDVGSKSTVAMAKPTQAPTTEKQKTSEGKTTKVDRAPKEPVKTKVEPKSAVKTEPAKKPAAESVKVANEKPAETTKRAEPATVPISEQVSRKPLVNESFDVTQGMTEHSIERVLRMNDTFNKFNNTEKQFVLGYFQVEDSKEGSISKVIYGALTASRRDLDALSKIVEARGKTAAERAFYLMGLSGNNIEAIHEQVDLLAGNLERIDGVNDSNKIDVCRIIESTISGMPDNVFAYIDKLQSFTNQALEQ